MFETKNYIIVYSILSAGEFCDRRISVLGGSDVVDDVIVQLYVCFFILKIFYKN
jgi:hypothetical protein